MSTTPYAPLSERQLRVLVLQPGPPGSQLVGDLQTITLTESNAATITSPSDVCDDDRISIDQQVSSAHNNPRQDHNRKGTSLTLEGKATLWVHGQRDDSSHVDSPCINLDTCLGNDDGQFDPDGCDFSSTAREVTLTGSTLFAQLKKFNGEWNACATDLKSIVKKYLKPISLTLEGKATLRVHGQRDDGSHIDSCIHLNAYFGNDNGHFDSSGTDFSYTARKVTLMGSMLAAQLRTVEGEWIPTTVDLNDIVEEYSAPVSTADPPHTRKPSTRISDEEQYKALSYCWGSPRYPNVLHLSHGCTILITSSLFDALQSLRYTDRNRRLWVDAICINQKSLDERASQVAMMDDIYTTASATIVWLGLPHDETSETLAFATLTAAKLFLEGDETCHFFDFLDDYLRTTESCACCGQPLVVPKALQHSRLEGEKTEQQGKTLASPRPKKAFGKGRAAIAGMYAIADLARRPWFQRLWGECCLEVRLLEHPTDALAVVVIQEVVFARSIEVYCGTHRADWKALVMTANFLYDVPRHFKPLMESSSTKIYRRDNIPFHWCGQVLHLDDLRDALWNNRLLNKPVFEAFGILTSIRFFGLRQCSDARDRVFAISSLFGLERFVGLRADYQVPLGELYRRFTAAILTSPASWSYHRAHPAFLLALVGTEQPDGNLLSRPSWVPHLHYLSARSTSKHSCYHSRSQGVFLKDKSEFRCQLPSGDSSSIRIRGKCFARITSVLEDSSPPVGDLADENRSINRDALVSLLQWYKRGREFLLHDGTGLTNVHDYFRARRLADDAGWGVRDGRDVVYQGKYPSLWTDIQELDKNIATILCCDQPFEASDSDVALHTISRALSGISSELESLPDMETLRRTVQYMDSVHRSDATDRSRSLCLADGEHGRLPGWVPLTAKVGDYLCYFAGAPFPFAVRSRDDGSFCLLGDAYVHAIEDVQILGADLDECRVVSDGLRACGLNGEIRGWSDGQEVRKQMGPKVIEWEDNLEQRSKDIYHDGCGSLGWVELR